MAVTEFVRSETWTTTTHSADDYSGRVHGCMCPVSEAPHGDLGVIELTGARVEVAKR